SPRSVPPAPAAVSGPVAVGAAPLAVVVSGARVAGAVVAVNRGPVAVDSGAARRQIPVADTWYVRRAVDGRVLWWRLGPHQGRRIGSRRRRNLLRRRV